MLIKCGKYILRHTKEGDWKPDVGHGFPITFALECENKQVGAVAGMINDIWGIKTDPPGKDHGTKFVKMMMKEAKRRGKTIFKVQSVDSVELEHILRNKLGFKQINKTWVKRLDP